MADIDTGKFKALEDDEKLTALFEMVGTIQKLLQWVLLAVETVAQKLSDLESRSRNRA